MLIRDYNNSGFSLFIDDHMGAAISFEAIFYFLHHYYFSYAIFGSIYLASYKTFVSTDQIGFVRFIGDKNRLWPLVKYRN